MTLETLSSQIPTLYAYIISFALVYLSWRSHHNAFEKADTLMGKFSSSTESAQDRFILGGLMIEFLKKYNMHLFILIVGILTIYDLANWNSISLVRKLVNVFAVFAILHEIEEKYWPGGFMELMLKKLKINIGDFDTETAKLNVVIFLLVYIFL